MTTFIALLRSVNVSGHGRLAMSELKEMFVTLGYRDVSTYIQTGNVIFHSSARNAAKLETDIEHQLERTFGAAPTVILRTAAELARTLATSPYPARGADPSRHHVTFLAAAPSPQRLAALSPPASGRDELTIIGREVYVHTPDGYGNTKLSGAYLERHLGVSSTTRNWNTVTKLCALAAG
jgi:uncharacterized protein (DUF1697 family)